MPPERAEPPARWATFLADVDRSLAAPVELHCLGGFVLAAAFGLPRPTADVDYIRAEPHASVMELESIAGRGSPIARRHGLYLQHVTVADVPEDYCDRLGEIFPGEFAKLRLLGLEVHDLVLAKLVRNSPVDLEDAKFLAQAGRIEAGILRERYERELRSNLANETRHDLTMKIWLEACFGR